MLPTIEYVKASSVWENARDYVDEGHCPGLVRGYNVEVIHKDGRTSWITTFWIDTTIEDHLNSEFMQWYAKVHEIEYTGRVMFRGYGEEEWDPDERDTYVCNIGPRKRTDDVPDSEFECLKRSI